MNAPHCPFCKGAISADLARFGGNCPHCMLEVPGEDAPTDPGAILREKQQAAEVKKAAVAARQSRVRVGIGAVAVLLLAVGAGFYAWSHQQARVYELEDYYVLPLATVASTATVTPPAAVAVSPTAAPSTTPGKKEKPTKTPTTGTPSSAVASSVTTPVAHTASSAAPADASPTVTGLTTGSVTLGGVQVDVAQPGLVLSDQQQIFDMAKTVINRYSPQMNNCYNQRLKQAPQLAGAWKMEFTITKDGTPSGISVSGLDQKDGELEACMRRSISAWRFLRIAYDQPIAKTYRFKPSS